MEKKYTMYACNRNNNNQYVLTSISAIIEYDINIAKVTLVTLNYSLIN